MLPAENPPGGLWLARSATHHVCRVHLATRDHTGTRLLCGAGIVVANWRFTHRFLPLHPWQQLCQPCLGAPGLDPTEALAVDAATASPGLTADTIPTAAENTRLLPAVRSC